MTLRAIAVALVGAALLLGGDASGAPRAPAGTVTFLAGEATRSAGGKAEALALGKPVYQGDLLETQKRTRLEVKLADQSVLRLGPSSKAEVAEAAFGKTVEERNVSAKLVVGKVWANVAKAVGGEQKFEVKTENAVAGVRGTTFRVDAATDRSVVVKVYGGTVAVASGTIPRPEHKGAAAEGEVQPAGGKPKRQQIAGPQQVTREQWEKIVTNMMEVHVSSDGVPTEPAKFALAEPGQDEWEEWNRSRDEQR
jgi:hypothetical protein